MALKQQIWGRWESAFGNNTEYRNVLAGGNQAFFLGFDVEVRQAPPIPVPGTFRNLRVIALTDLGSGDTATFTFRKAGADQSLSAQLTDTIQEADDIANEVAVVAGNTVALKRVTAGSPAANDYFWCVEWEPDDPDVAVYGYGSGSTNLAANQFEGVFSGGVVWETESLLDIVAVPGQLTKHYVVLETAPGAGTSRTFTVFLDDVAQDGSGGTPDTRVTIADAATTGNASFSLQCAVGTRLSVKNTVSGSPAATRQVGSFAFHSDTADNWNLSGSATLTASGTSTLYADPAGDSCGISATESDSEHRAPIRPFSISGLRVAVDSAPGASKEWQFTLRLTGADSTITAAVTGTNLTAVSSGAAAQIVSGDLLSMQLVPVNTPAQTNGQRWTFMAGPVQFRGSAVFGVTTTVKATRSVAFGLDDATNVHDEAGKLKVFGHHSVTGYQELVEMTAPAGAANKARIFAVDDGSGKTRLMVQFGSGSAIELAVEL